MHEQSLMKGLVRQVEQIVRDQGARRALGVTLRRGPLAIGSPEHLREHFVAAARGSLAEGAWLKIETVDSGPQALSLDLTLDSVEVEDEPVV